MLIKCVRKRDVYNIHQKWTQRSGKRRKREQLRGQREKVIVARLSAPDIPNVHVTAAQKNRSSDLEGFKSLHVDQDIQTYTAKIGFLKSRYQLDPI